MEKSVSQIAVIERPISHYRRQTCGPASIELRSAQSSASSHGGKCSLQTRRRSSTLPPILRARIDLYNSRSHAIDARSPPDVGRLRVVVLQLVPVLRHRQHPHGAERGNHRDIHDDPHGPIPRFHTVRELRLLARSCRRERKSCGCGFQATKARVRFVRRAYPPCQRHRDAGVALVRARTLP